MLHSKPKKGNKKGTIKKTYKENGNYKLSKIIF